MTREVPGWPSWPKAADKKLKLEIKREIRFPRGSVGSNPTPGVQDSISTPSISRINERITKIYQKAIYFNQLIEIYRVTHLRATRCPKYC